LCGFCDIENKEEEKINLFTEQEIDTFIFGVFAGIYSVKNLDLSTYLKIARKLSQGVFTGYSKTFSDVFYGSEDFTMLKALQENVYMFSAAKQYTMLREMNKYLVTDKKVTPFVEFKKQASVIFDEFNENYLRAEYNSAIGQARSASRWQEYVKESNVFPMLTYKTAGDGRVRPEHEILDNISRPVGDKFWNHYYPPNGWNCRCIVIQEGDEVKPSKVPKDISPDDVPIEFRFNAGKDKVIFSKQHPYFKGVSRKDKPFAKQNFGMPL
jgi:hypothetical protein